MMTNNNVDSPKSCKNTPCNTNSVFTKRHSATDDFSNGANSNTNINSNAKPNANGYFGCLDNRNRIGNNLMTVINGARGGRSSSCSKSAFAHTDNGLSNSNINLNTPARNHQQHHIGLPTSRQQAPPSYLHLQNNGSSRKPASPRLSSYRRAPLHFYAQANSNCNDSEDDVETLSSDEDNSPTKLNNCKRLTEKPPLVKRLTMGLLRLNEDSRPLVPTTGHNPTNASCNKVYSNGYINEEAFEPEKCITSKFGDSCRQSLNAIPLLDTLNVNDNGEFNQRKSYLRETSSANSSPKIFRNKFRLNSTNTAGSNWTSTENTTNMFGTTTLDDNEAQLKDACWFQIGISRKIAVEVLSNKSPGAFLVRKSNSKPGCYALTLRVPSPPGPKTMNYIILRTTRGYKIKGFSKEFSTLKALITHHSVMHELLPVPLTLPRPTNATSSRRNLDDFDTYDSLQMLLKYLRVKRMESD